MNTQSIYIWTKKDGILFLVLNKYLKCLFKKVIKVLPG